MYSVFLIKQEMSIIQHPYTNLIRYPPMNIGLPGRNISAVPNYSPMAGTNIPIGYMSNLPIQCTVSPMQMKQIEEDVQSRVQVQVHDHTRDNHPITTIKGLKQIGEYIDKINLRYISLNQEYHKLKNSMNTMNMNQSEKERFEREITVLNKQKFL